MLQLCSSINIITNDSVPCYKYVIGLAVAVAAPSLHEQQKMLQNCNVDIGARRSNTRSHQSVRITTERGTALAVTSQVFDINHA